MPFAFFGLVRTYCWLFFWSRRDFVTPEDIQDLAPDVMRHRIVLTFDAEAEGLDADAVVRHVLGAVPVP